MRRTRTITSILLGILLFGIVSFLVWTGTGRLSETQSEWKTSYSTAFASADRDTFTVMTYNLGHLAGATSRTSTTDGLRSANLNQVAELVRRVNPDVVGFQNVGLETDQSRMHPLDTLASRLGYPNAVQAVSWDRHALFPFTPDRLKARPEGTVSGQAILSRYPIRRHLRRVLPDSSMSLWDAISAPDPLVQIAALDIGGWPLVVMNADLTRSNVEVREEQARQVNRLYGRLVQQGFPVLLLGTFHSLMPGATAASTGVPIRFADDETMSILLVEGQSQSALSSEVAQVTGEAVNTYPADDPTWKTDYILHHPDSIIPVNEEVHCGEAPPPSSHCAVTMSFLLPRPKDRLPDGPIPDENLPSLDSLVAPGGDEWGN